MRQVHLPKTATIKGIKVRLNWDMLDNLDGWYAEVSKRTLRRLESDESVHMADVERELSHVGDYARYGQDRTGTTYLCVYKHA